MKILHYSLGVPPYRSGGLTKYSIDLMLNQRDLGHEVFLLYPGHFSIFKKLKIVGNSDFKGIKVFEIVNPLPVSLLGGIKKPELFLQKTEKEKYIDFIKKLNPEIIHLHTFMGLHKEFLEAAKECRVKIVYTTHDYFGICPKVNLMDTNQEVCDDFDEGNRCISCNMNGYSSSMLFLLQSKTYRTLKESSVVKKARTIKKGKEGQTTVQTIPEKNKSSNEGTAEDYVKLRNYYLSMFNLVDSFHFNSTLTKKEYEKYLHLSGKVIPIAHNDINDNRVKREFFSKEKPLKITYIGPIDAYKGFFLLKESLDYLLSKNISNWHLSVYGNAHENIEYDSNFYSFYGRYNYNELEKIFNNTDVLVIPSIWKETFGFIGLEALSHSIPILASEFVGFNDLIEDKITGFIFEPNVEGLATSLEDIIENRELLTKINENINNMVLNFAMKKHTEEIINFYKII